MSDDHRKPKWYKNILSWFSSDSSSTRRSGNESGSRNVTENDGNDILVNPSPSIPHEDCQNERVEIEQETDINSLEHNPGKRLSIWKYSLNEHNNAQRFYVILGLKEYDFISFMFVIFNLRSFGFMSSSLYAYFNYNNKYVKMSLPLGSKPKKKWWRSTIFFNI